MGAFKRKEKGVPRPMFNSNFVSNGLVVSLVAIPVEMVGSLVFRFWRHGKTYENNHFLG